VMSKGIVAQLGTPIEIYERPQSRFVADFIGETNFLEGTVAEQQGKTVIVKVGEGLTVQAESDNALSQGSGVTVAIRPEKLHLLTNGTAPAGEMNLFRGRVAEVIYIGTDTHYAVLFANGQKVRVRGQNADPISRPMAQTGDEVNVAFAQNAARVLTE
jgi:spermidine/putrescine transport system ATP-binding protein